MSKRVAILGASGYTGLELIRLLLRHPEVEITALGTRQEENPHVSEVHPQLTGQLDLRLEPLTAEQLAERADSVFCCLPHAASAEAVAQLMEHELDVVDLSADYRLRDKDVYEKWYGVTHPDAGRLPSAVYGLPELYRNQIKASHLVANPGCYPTSAILALYPLLKAGLISPAGINIDSKSGVSGGGRTPKPAFHYPECNESLMAYGVGAHRHMPEIDQMLTEAAGESVEVLFTPHLVPMDRGILSTCYATPVGDVDTEGLMACLRETYADEPFVDVVDKPPTTKHVAFTNRCHLTARVVRGRALVISVIDNLIKGASGAAVQNFNLMQGYKETTALI
ncbi:N-acetyl-gamma-glutamyl-phosphate reductase [Aeoliella sp. ICT_H6.2]|uniref:N-acetyl-gamma-glutamyl-phosphate reductase n=2 Tax=Aeoliella straminimaris TaxID=2954799 RepID=A0A9X2JHX5_9BACT|nr:N-acetyl-gamma-glutamyl-phosphate reductase [Aeoliella straminimaris]MCO6043364.1 N-acetyl-gamma-glutamyl-phosphate reductase [Aeoliella straminimaris]